MIDLTAVRAAAVALGAGAVIALTACGSADRDAPLVERETLPDGRVVVSYASRGGAVEETVSPDVRIGSLEGGGPTTFGDVRGIAVGPDGTIYVFDAQASEVRVFAADGEYRTTLGRSGRGPGEISQGHGIALAPDGVLWINDSSNRAIIGLAHDGREVGRHPLMVGGYSFVWSGSIDDRGVFWERWSHPLEPFSFDITATGPTQTSLAVFYKSFDPREEAYDSVRIGLASAVGYRAAIQGGQMSLSIPFTAGRLATIDRHANIWTALSDAYAVTKTNAAGDTLVVLRMAESASPVTPKDLEEWRERSAAAFERVPGIQADLERLIPATKPVLTRLLTDDVGRLWVERPTPPGAASLFDVFDPDGEFLASVRLFPGLSPFVSPVIRGGRAYALVRGELDEAYVVAAPLPAALGG